MSHIEIPVHTYLKGILGRRAVTIATIIPLINHHMPMPDPRILDEDALRLDRRPAVLALQKELYNLEDQLQDSGQPIHHLFALARRADEARLAYRLALEASKAAAPCEYVREAEVQAFIRERLALATALGGRCRILTFGAALRVNYRGRDGRGKSWFFQPIPGGFRHCGTPTDPLSVGDWEDALLFRFTERLPG